MVRTISDLAKDCPFVHPLTSRESDWVPVIQLSNRLRRMGFEGLSQAVLMGSGWYIPLRRELTESDLIFHDAVAQQLIRPHLIPGM